MSLKDLVEQAKKSTVTPVHSGNDQIPRKKSTVPSFQSVSYDIDFETPSKKDLITLLETILSQLKAAGDEIPSYTMKRIILAFYRIAFSQDARAEGCFHPSEISTEVNLCHRKLYFQKGRVKKDITFVPFTADNRMKRLVDLGTMLHLYMQENLDRAGILSDFEVEVKALKYGIEGKMDGKVLFVGYDDLQNYYDEEEMALEFKSINDRGFSMLRSPKPEHLKQASLYSYPLGLKRICFVYYNKILVQPKYTLQRQILPTQRVSMFLGLV